jgi:inorganic pyrophosphatase
MRAMECACG